MAMPSCSGSMQERRPRLRHQRNRALGTSPFSNFGCSVTCSSGEPPIGAWFLTCRHAWLVVLGEDLTDEFSPAAHADLIEDGLEVIPHGVGRDVQLPGDFGCGQPAQDEPRYLTLALGQAVGIDDQRGDLRRTGLLEDDGYLPLGALSP